MTIAACYPTPRCGLPECGDGRGPSMRPPRSYSALLAAPVSGFVSAAEGWFLVPDVIDWQVLSAVRILCSHSLIICSKGAA
jgi:hypothetical protein